MLVAEFTIPTSPLYRNIFALIGNAQLCPEPRVARHSVLQDSIDVTKLSEERVHCVVDKGSDTDREVCFWPPNKKGSNIIYFLQVDLCVPLMYSIKLCFSLKDDKNATRNSICFEDFFNKFAEDPLIYPICVSVQGVTKKFRERTCGHNPMNSSCTDHLFCHQ
jgi:hypothetical protein